MIEQWNIPKPMGVCAATGRPFAPGEVYWAAVLIQDGAFVRREYSQAAWNDDLRGQAFSYWRVTMPCPDEPPARRFVDDEVILEFFRRLDGRPEPEHVNFRYVLGLLLVRKKALKLIDIDHENGVERLLLKEKGADTQHRVLAPILTDEALLAVRQQVSQVLNLDGQEEEAPGPAQAAERAPSAERGEKA